MQGIQDIKIRDADGGAIISVRAVPGSSRDRIVGVLGDCLKIATSAAAEKGKANKAVAALLADALGVSGSSVTLVAGPASRRKEFRVLHMTAERVRAKLASR